VNALPAVDVEVAQALLLASGINMKRLSLTLLCSAGLISSAGCFNKDKSTTDPETAAAAEGGEAAGETAPGEAAERPNRSSASASTRDGGSKTKGRMKTFEAPQPLRTATVVPGAIDVPKELVVGEVRPSMAPKGSQVEIFGSGFGDAKGDIKVMNGRSPWEVVEVYDDRIVAVVGKGMDVGSVSVNVGKSSGKTGNSFQPLGGDTAFESASPDLHGLIGTVYAHEGAKVPDFSSLDGALGTIGLNQLAIGETAASDFEQGMSNYAINFTGSLNVTNEGEYDLCLKSGGGSRLLIMDTLVVDNTSGDSSGCELVYLEAGEYDLAIEYVQSSETPTVTLGLSWTFDGGANELIPADALFRP
jgi:hypothetical protein